ncbi:hypothetical protein CRP01_04180 [Flavilitoribacter nigricans DSM 23189 = NBRC 102662]|uniref:Uncharacterized protein n=1 Tax=Flavilitoribacter nigricans (strain ATCC 23147 / DSM 23189 / NBRC 102662 / NCIMB 1420 / SS-2) TaxID=1122177 RepID=A0A2D0NIE2_FLAN2|nr:hypothetical protein CRP01_04180 [Flavilitoribacter nigricans DSM 23189 = NBRC 102662]
MPVLLVPVIGRACFCLSPGVEKEYQRSDAVFIGGLIEKSETEFFFSGRYPIPLQLFHFEVLEISKGLEPTDQRITMIDHHHDSTCGGLFREQEVGDTILVFAQKTELKYHLQVLSSSPCNGNLVVNDLARHDSLAVIRQLPWNTVAFNESIFYYEEDKRRKARKAEQDIPERSFPFLPLALIASVLLNLFLIGRLRFRPSRTR